MRKILAAILLLGFILWIMPLGYFIKPSQEKIFCDGLRGMCMCHTFIKAKAQAAMEHGLVFAPAPAKENPDGGAANYFVSPKRMVLLHLNLLSSLEDPHLLYTNPSIALVDAVPRI